MVEIKYLFSWLLHNNIPGVKMLLEIQNPWLCHFTQHFSTSDATEKPENVFLFLNWKRLWPFLTQTITSHQYAFSFVWLKLALLSEKKVLENYSCIFTSSLFFSLEQTWFALNLKLAMCFWKFFWKVVHVFPLVGYICFTKNLNDTCLNKLEFPLLRQYFV